MATLARSSDFGLRSLAWVMSKEVVRLPQRVGMDLLVYHDMTDFTGAQLKVGANAGEEFGETFEGYYIGTVH